MKTLPPKNCIDLVDAGIVRDDYSFNPNTEKYDLRKIKITCPRCQKIKAPLLNKSTKAQGYEKSWASPEYYEYETTYSTTCKCGQCYRFTVISEE